MGKSKKRFVLDWVPDPYDNEKVWYCHLDKPPYTACPSSFKKTKESAEFVMNYLNSSLEELRKKYEDI